MIAPTVDYLGQKVIIYEVEKVCFTLGFDLAKGENVT